MLITLWFSVFIYFLVEFRQNNIITRQGLVGDDFSNFQSQKQHCKSVTYSVAISMRNVQISPIPFFYQFRHLLIGHVMPLSRSRIISFLPCSKCKLHSDRLFPKTAVEKTSCMVASLDISIPSKSWVNHYIASLSS